MYSQVIKIQIFSTINLNKKKRSIKRTEKIINALSKKPKPLRFFFTWYSSAAYSAITRKCPNGILQRKIYKCSFFTFSEDCDYIRIIFTFLLSFFRIIKFCSCIILYG